MRVIKWVNSSVLPKPSGTSAHDLIVHVQHDRIAGGFDPQHRISQQIARNAGDDVLGPQAAIGAIAVTAVLELPSSVVGEHDDLVALVFDLDVRQRIAELAAARQLQL